MKKKLLGILVISFLMISSNIQCASGAGKYKWWSTSATGQWFGNGVICYTVDKETQPGQKFKYTYKLGQSKKFVTLGSGISISGDTLVDDNGNVPSDDSEFNPDELSQECDDGAGSIAYVSPVTPDAPGSYIIRVTTYSKSGSILWTDDLNILVSRTGAESGSNFFTNPPNIYFTDYTYANLNPSNGIKAYTSKGKPRNACLLIYDIAVKGMRTDVSVSSSDLISSAQGGFFGANVRSIIGNAAIPTAIKCSPWIATYLW